VGAARLTPLHRDADWVVGTVETPLGEVSQISTTLRFADRLGAWKARWGIGRMHYRVQPGLYAVGRPTADSPVLVTANYKMSFDRLRCELGGLDAWILVLDTRGINVWCAAGKGTFGTEELVRRIEAVQLSRITSHRKLIVPQLGAPGIAAHEVKQQSGFRVVYGPVLAADVPAFLAAGNKATETMRQVRFPLGERAALIPMELIPSFKYGLPIALFLLLFAGLGTNGDLLERMATTGVWSAALLLATCVFSTIFTPVLLPWLPGRAFSVKGVWLGLALVAAVTGLAYRHPGVLGGPLSVAAFALMIPALASFLAMNFTGASTYTSLSGVRREMAFAVPVQAVAAVSGIILWIVGRFV